MVLGGADGAASAGLIGAGASAAGAVDAHQRGKRAEGRQAQAQATAERRARSTQRENEIAQNRANRRQPDIASILANAQRQGQGVGGTLLTGQGGLDASRLRLGSGGLLGG